MSAAFEFGLIAIVLFAILAPAEAGLAGTASTTLSHSGGGATVKITYAEPQPAAEVRFQIALDTHSVNLDGYDLKSLAVLRDANGKTHAPTNVENKGSATIAKPF